MWKFRRGSNSELPHAAVCRDCLGPSHAVRERIQAERLRLQKAQAVISALGYSLNHDAIEIEDAGDVTAVVGDLVGQAVNAMGRDRADAAGGGSARLS